ncbi:unnamed protein product [Hermetia illucens]|uniref:Uncharacterized protein n=1 Tax=Hermetia illucens TaxID=343691 RepID=A0A7R8YQK7_HERIL|nr:unnamed protein product [Hermetia illucens]
MAPESHYYIPCVWALISNVILFNLDGEYIELQAVTTATLYTLLKLPKQQITKGQEIFWQVQVPMADKFRACNRNGKYNGGEKLNKNGEKRNEYGSKAT